MLIGGGGVIMGSDRVPWRTAVGALIRSLDLRARESQNTCSISDQT